MLYLKSLSDNGLQVGFRFKMATTTTVSKCLCSYMVVLGTLCGLQPSFYPAKAEEVGAKPSEYGFVFGIVNLASFVSTPFFAHYGNKIGPKLLYNTFGHVQGITMISFGFLDYVEDTKMFLGLSYLLRIFEGVTRAACITCILSILMAKYPEKISFVSGLSETIYGFGYMIGPAIGSGLFVLGGFGLPYYVMGGICTALAFIQIFTVPTVQAKEKETSQNDKDHHSLTVLEALKHPSLLLPIMDNFATSCGIGMLEVTMERYMKASVQANQLEVTIAFVIYGICYMLCAPCAGYVCDRLSFPIIVALLGNLLSILSFFLLGPSPLLPLLPTVPLIYGMMALFGVANAMLVVSTTSRTAKYAKAAGFEDDIGKFLVISAMCTGSFQLGYFAGPTFTGIMVENWGFRNTTMFFFGLYSTMSLIDFIGLTNLLRQRRANSMSV